MNGDISVDIEPIHRTTGHKSAAFVGGYNTIDAPTRMTGAPKIRMTPRRD
jgi:hypothetical protein